MDNLTYISFIAITVSLALMLPLMEKKMRHLLVFMIAGIFSCLFVSELNNILLGAFHNDIFFVTTTITPITEEVVKMLPILFFAIMVTDDRRTLIPISFAVGVGFALLEEDQTVCCKLPVRLLDSYESVKIAEPAPETQPAETQPAETQPVETQPEETQPAETPSTEEPTNDDSITEQSSMEPSTTEAPTTEAPVTEVPVTEVPAEPGKYINLTMLTPRDGLPASAGRITGMRDPSVPYIERTERSDRNNKYQASVFGKGGNYALIIGGVLILAAAAAIIIRKSSAKNKSKSVKPKGRR